MSWKSSLCPYCDCDTSGTLPMFNIFYQQIYPCTPCYNKNEHMKYSDKNTLLDQAHSFRSISLNLKELQSSLAILIEIIKNKA